MSEPVTNPSRPDLHIDFAAISALFQRADTDGRDFLFEHEVYQLLQDSGAETPPGTWLIFNEDRPRDEDLARMPGEKVVLKIVSPTIVHKTEVAGVRIVLNTPEKIRSARRRMLYEVPRNFLSWLAAHPTQIPPVYHSLDPDELLGAVQRDILGVLLVRHMPPDSEAFGNELIVSIRRSREFGMVINAGLGGIDTELFAERFRTGQAVISGSTAMITGDFFFELFTETITYKKLAGLTRGQSRIVTDEQLLECFASFIQMANYFSPVNPEAAFVIEELEVNPFAFTDFLMVPLDGLCRFSRPEPLPVPRPIWKIYRLLHPESIGIIGVSAKRVNFGRTILTNILGNGFDPARVRIIKPGSESIDGVRCVPDVQDLEQKLDLLVVAVDSSQVPGVIKGVLDREVAETVMLIAGGIGEKAGSRELAQDLTARINQSRSREDRGPIFLGSNCLGVVSHPGRYDTLFIAEEKLPKQWGTADKTAFVSQSGAFMITRISKRPHTKPSYLVSAGNQTDLTLGDLALYFKDHPELTSLAFYLEGFKDLDGLRFAGAVREAVLRGKEVLVYKAGRTPEGKTATSGHTASLAGDYAICEACLGQAGAMVARTFTQFEDLFLLSELLWSKKISGNRLAAVSGAGFEAVGMADSIQSDDYQLQMAALNPETCAEIEDVLKKNQLHTLVDVNNPLDINPGADDLVHARVVSLLAADSGVDAVVVGLDPLSPVTRTLGHDPRYSFESENSIARLLPDIVQACEKPIVAVVDGGKLFDPLVEVLEQAKVPVFRSSDRAVEALALYILGRLRAEALRERAERRA